MNLRVASSKRRKGYPPIWAVNVRIDFMLEVVYNYTCEYV